MMFSLFFFFKQKTAYEMRISDWSSDVCSSDLRAAVLIDDGIDDEDLSIEGAVGQRVHDDADRLVGAQAGEHQLRHAEIDLDGVDLGQLDDAGDRKSVG